MKIKNINIDICRLIAAFMIVAIHVYPFKSLNEDVDYIITRVIFRIAVPFFLMITGYFLIPKILSKKDTLIKYTKKILKIYLICIIIYIPINIYNGYFNYFSIISFIKDILIDGTFYHLWYFPALILGLWITCFVINKCNKNMQIIIIILLYLIGLFGDSYYGLINNIDILKMLYNFIFNVSTYTRNGLFYVPIFLYMGYSFNNKYDSDNKTVLLLIINVLLMISEGIVLYFNKIPRHNSMYIFLIPTSYFIFKYIISSNKKKSKKIRNIATLTYILHPLFIIIIHFLSNLPYLNIIAVNSIINYILVLIATIIFSIIILNLKIIIIKNKK